MKQVQLYTVQVDENRNIVKEDVQPFNGPIELESIPQKGNLIVIDMTVYTVLDVIYATSQSIPTLILWEVTQEVPDWYCRVCQ